MATSGPAFTPAKSVGAFLREQAAWRHEQARRHPLDRRNGRSANALEQLASYVEGRPDDDRGLRELIDAHAFDDHGRFIPSPEAKRITARYGYDYDATVTPRTVLIELAAAARRNASAAARQSASWFVRSHKNEPYHIRIRDLSGDRALTIANEELELGGGTAELLELPTGAARCERCWATLREIQRSAGPDLVSPLGTLESLDAADRAIRAFVDARTPASLEIALAAVEDIGPPPDGTSVDWPESKRLLLRVLRVAGQPHGSVYAASIEAGSILKLLREDAEFSTTTADAAAIGVMLSGSRSAAHRETMLRRLVDLANAGDQVAVEYLEAHPALAFVDGLSQKWVVQVDSGRGPGIAVGRDSLGRGRVIQLRADDDNKGPMR